MPATDQGDNERLRETAYFIWEREGRPDGRAQDHWLQAAASLTQHKDNHDPAEDEEKVLAGRPDANIPALLTKDVPGG
jgi:hypothetical protein